jgi:hypothetical protein
MALCFLVGLMLLPSLAAAQSAQTSEATKAKAQAPVDLSGVWRMHMPASARPYINFAFTAEEPPMTPWAIERFKASKPSFGPRTFPIQETNDPVYHGCFPPGVPRIYLHPFPMQILQTADEVVMLFEYDQMRRQIYIDGRPHDTSVGPTWMGDSIGHWEGDTLVVDTIGMNDKTWLDRMGHPHSDQLHVVERFRRPSRDTLEIAMTFEDPKAYTKPWGTTLIYELKPTWKIMEQFCEDNDTFMNFEQRETTPAK